MPSIENHGTWLQAILPENLTEHVPPSPEDVAKRRVCPLWIDPMIVNSTNALVNQDGGFDLVFPAPACNSELQELQRS